jgi:ketosteroid isomerase-like protein
MSQEFIESLRKALSVANDDGMEAATAEFGHLLHPDFGIDEATGVPDPEHYTGREAFVENLRKLEEAFDQIRIEPLEFVDLGDQLVVVVAMSGRGRGSGAAVEMTFTQLWTVREGKAASLHDYATKAEALEAAGLSE